MEVDFKNSRTKENLMKAFVGESQARNRYTFAADQAKKQNLHVLEVIFKFTADQEKEHAEIYYNHLKDLSGENLNVEGTYPIDISNSMLDLLKASEHNEYQEYEPVYKEFFEIAKEEGFPEVAFSFSAIAEIEKTHGDRFGKFAELLEQNKLFISDVECSWMCLNCGYCISSKEAPKQCPVCSHDQGYFIRLTLAPYTE